MGLNLSLDASACCCMGPQNGEPLCPCRMRGVVKINGKWYQELEPVSVFGPFDSDLSDVYNAEEEPDD